MKSCYFSPADSLPALSSKVDVEVTQDDINNGFRNSCERCPWALAFARKFPAFRIAVDGETISFCDPITGMMLGAYKTPAIVNLWIDRFDDSLPILPMRAIFYLEDGNGE